MHNATCVVPSRSLSCIRQDPGDGSWKDAEAVHTKDSVQVKAIEKSRVGSGIILHTVTLEYEHNIT